MYRWFTLNILEQSFHGIFYVNVWFLLISPWQSTYHCKSASHFWAFPPLPNILITGSFSQRKSMRMRAIHGVYAMYCPVPYGPNSSIQIVYPNHWAQCLENPRLKWCFLMGKPSINFNKWWIFHQAMFDEQRVHYSWICGNVWAPWGFSSFFSGMFRQQNVAQFL